MSSSSFVGRFGGCCQPSFFSHRVHRRCLRAGDHLYVWSSFAHHHHAVYIGAGRDVGYTPTVIHVYGENKHASEVRRDTLIDFAKGRTVRRARYGVPWWHLYLKPAGTCFAFDADAPDTIVGRAWQWLRADQGARAARRADDAAASLAEEEAQAAERRRRRMAVNAEIDAASEGPDLLLSVPESSSDVEPGGVSSDETGPGGGGELEVLKRMLRSGNLPARASEGALIHVADSPWVYDLFRRNCEHFTLMCTAPSKQSGSHQAQQLTRFNPFVTLLYGALVRLNYYRRMSRVDDFFSRVLRDPRVSERRSVVRRHAARTRLRGRMLRTALRWRAAATHHRLRTRMAVLRGRLRAAAAAALGRQPPRAGGVP